MIELENAFNAFKEEAELCFVKNFIISDKIKKEYSNCLDIIFNLTGTTDATKGVLAYNKWYGTGKSFFFDVVYSRCDRLTQKPFKKTSAKELRFIFEQEGQEGLENFIKCKNIFIDDIGDEDDKDGSYTFHHYKTSLNVMRYVLLKRYEYWSEFGWKTFGTTNLDLPKMAKIYDHRVADRLAQMVYIREFDFLQDGESFRQSESTRLLTKSEIKENLEKSKPEPKAPEPLDLEKYFNELISEPDDYFSEQPNSFWEFTKQYLVKKEILTPADFNQIDADFLDSARMVLRNDKRAIVRLEAKHTKNFVRNKIMERTLSSITSDSVYKAAENLIARRKFMELRQKLHNFV